MSTSPTLSLDLRYSSSSSGHPAPADGRRMSVGGGIGDDKMKAPSVLPPTRSVSDDTEAPTAAAALLATFRELSNSRDAALTRVDSQSPAQRRLWRLSEQPQQLKSPLSSRSSAGGLSTVPAPLGSPRSGLAHQKMDVERTITIGAGRDKYAADPSGTPVSSRALQRNGSGGGSGGLWWSSEGQRHVVRGDTGVFAPPGGTVLTTSPHYRRDAVQLTASPPPRTWVDEDCFDRSTVAEREATLTIGGGSPRVYAPEYDHEYPVPQPEERLVAGAAGGVATEGDAFVRRGAHAAVPLPFTSPSGQGSSWGVPGDFTPPPVVHSPPPRLPAVATVEEPAYQDRLRSSSEGDFSRAAQPNGGFTMHVPQSDNGDDGNGPGQPAAAAKRRSASEDFASVGDSRSASPMLAFYGADGEPAKSDGAWMDFFGKPIPVPPALAVASSNTLPATRSPASAIPYRQQRPSKLLVALVEAVALRRQAALIPSIPIAVIHAFDNVVQEGAYFIKYSLSGAPHERFFSLRFVDVAHRAPEPCLLWSVHRTSWSAKGLINLASIVNVYAGTGGSPAFQKYLLDGTRIRGPMLGGPHRSVLPTTFAFVVESFGTEEPLSLLSLSRPQFDAWIRFLRFIASIGYDGVVGSKEADGEYDYDDVTTERLT